MPEIKPLSFRLRIWLARRLSGKHALEAFDSKVDKAMIHVAVQQLYENLGKFTSDMAANTLKDWSLEMLSSVIESNSNLSEIKKSQILYVIHSPAEKDSIFFG